MDFNYITFTFVVMVGIPVGFLFLHKFILNKYCLKMSEARIISLHAAIAIIFTSLAWFHPAIGWLFFILSLGLELYLVYIIVKKSFLPEAK